MDGTLLPTVSRVVGATRVVGRRLVPRVLVRRAHRPIGRILNDQSWYGQQQSGSRHFDQLGGATHDHHQTKLPSASWAPAVEFPALASDFAPGPSADLERVARMSRSMAASMIQPERLAFLGSSVALIWAIGFAEAHVLIAPDFCASHPLEALRF